MFNSSYPNQYHSVLIRNKKEKKEKKGAPTTTQLLLTDQQFSKEWSIVGGRDEQLDKEKQVVNRSKVTATA